ncbi:MULTISPECIES: DUF998 domain-containing protein [Streptomyces]|uniref:DUF998 domain-containing protein n=1 Tax=Streptomyces TaxID=1883 RepID=UPI000FAAF2AA|nr:MULTISPECIES: DUF998 domain-containing protein [Streptomyces]RSS25479.1 DUF998 domain-containing protein [Streptomyces sp. WAC05458]WQC10923.1 DUF998 domain-containing protein [Streptomyces rochei]
MRFVPKWVLLSSGGAPALLIGGWSGAALFEGSAYDPATQTISVLGAYGAAGYWVMTTAFLALGVCHLLTAWGLRAAATAGRVALGGGGVAAFAVALLPAPSSGGSLRHGAVAVVGFTLLAVWPLLAVDGGAAAPWALRPAPAVAVCVLMAAGGAWFLFEMQRHGNAGVAERVVTFFQSAWPFVVAVSCLRHVRRAAPPPLPD